MRESRNIQTSASTPRDCFLCPVAIATGPELSGQVCLQRRLEFEDVLSRNLSRFQRMAMGWLRNREDAEDAVQDAMLSACKHIARFEGRAQMSTWVMAIVINAVRMQLRRRPRYKLLPLDQPTQDEQGTVSDFVADHRPTPEQTLEECELRKLVIKLIVSLPPSQRIAMELRQRDDGLSMEDAAEALGVPVGTLKAQLARGRATLTKRLREALGWSGSPERRQRVSKGNKPDMFRTAASAGCLAASNTLLQPACDELVASQIRGKES
jgi:RNA polymerase sigma-70 factor, ECF subfamily